MKKNILILIINCLLMGIALPSAKAVKVELAENPVLQNDLNQLTEEEKRQFN